MGKCLYNIIIFGILFLSVISIFESKDKTFVFCEDEVEEVSDEDEAAVVDGDGSQMEGTETEEEDPGIKGSPDVDTIILFTKPNVDGAITDLPAGKLSEFLVGFTNNADRDFVLDSIEASFRYPMDFTYYIQNFTAIAYQRTVKPRQEATLMYSFYPAEAFAGRPLGLSVNLGYHNADGESFMEAIFNQTVTITDVEEGLDGETFFLYVFLLAFCVLLLLAGHHLLSSFGRKKGSAPKKNMVETGTNIKDGIDYDWIPKELLQNHLSKKPSRQSPPPRGGRKSKRE